MKRFVTVFAALLMGATLFTTAMAQAKTPVRSGEKKIVAAKTHKKAVVKPVVKKAVVAKKTDAKKPTVPMAKSKTKKAVGHVSRTRTTGHSAKAPTKRSMSTRTSPIRTESKVKSRASGTVKRATAPKGGKVVNRR